MVPKIALISLSFFFGYISRPMIGMTHDELLKKEFENLSHVLSQDMPQAKTYGISYPHETLTQTINRTFPKDLLDLMKERFHERIEKQKAEQQEKLKAEQEKQIYDQIIAFALARIKKLFASQDPLDHIIALQESHALRMGLLTKFSSTSTDQATLNK